MSTSTFVAQLYTDILGRAPDLPGLAWWTQAIDGGTMTAAQVTQQFIDSPEFDNVVPALARLYFAAFGRIPDENGLRFWTQAAQNGVALDAITSMFGASTEFQTLYGPLDHAAFLDALMQKALGHAMDAGTKAGWLAKLSAGTATRTDVLASVVTSSEMTQAKAQEVKVIAQFHGTIGTTPTQQQIDAAIAAKDPVGLITKMYASPDYSGAAVPGLNAHGTITDALGAGATVFVDLNHNGKLDAGEVSVKADNAGHFDFGDHAVFGGTLTVQPASGGANFTAAGGASVVNALTTVVQQVAAARHVSTADAEQLVRQSFNLDPNLSISATDAGTTAANPTLAESVRAAAAHMQGTSAQVAMVIAQTAAALRGLGLTTDAVQANAAALQAVSLFITDPSRQGAVDLANSGAVTTLLKTAAGLLTASPAQMAALTLAAPELAKVIVDINSAIVHATGGTASELVAQIGVIETNAQAALSKLAAGDIAGALASLSDLTHVPLVTVSGGGAGYSAAGAPSLISPLASASTVKLGFSEDVQAGSGYIVISDGDSQTKFDASTGKLTTRMVGATDTRIINVHDSHVTFTDGELKIDMASPLTAGKTYSVMIDYGVVADSDGLFFTGVTQSGWKTITPIDVPRTAYAKFPSGQQGYMNAGAQVLIKVGFNQNVNIDHSSVLTLHDAQGGAFSANAVYDSGDGSSVITFKYTVHAGDNAAELQLDSAADLVGHVTNSFGDVLSGAYINFTEINDNGYGIIVDTTAPTITSLSLDKASLAANETATVDLMFSESVSGVALTDFTGIHGSLSNLSSLDSKHWTATFTADSALADTGGIVTFTPAAVEDYAHNAATGSTSNGTAELHALTAQFGSNDYGVYKKIGDIIKFNVTFDHPVYFNADHEPTFSIKAGGAEEGIAQYDSGEGSNTLTFAYTVQEGDSSLDLDFNKTGGHNFLNAAHIVFDHIAHNEYGAMKVDGTRPAVVTDNLDHDAPDATLYAAKLVLHFSEEVSFGSGSIELHDADTDALVMAYNSSSANWALDTGTHQALTLDMPTSGSFVTPGHYYITIVGHAIRDDIGNDMTAYSSPTDFAFTVPVTS